MLVNYWSMVSYQSKRV